MDDVIANADAQLRAVYAGRAIVLVGDVAAGATPRVNALRALGAERILVVATGRGTGLLPDAELHVHELPVAENMVASFRLEEQLFAAPPPEVMDAIAAFDPDRTALILAPPFFDVRSIGDRELFGPRRSEWVALEDKTRNDELFDAADVPHPPATVVAFDPAALLRAAAELDTGEGTVWAGDARDGFNGGGVFVRWVRDADDRDEAFGFFSSRCDRVRVAPFVEGIPCSIHGFVTGSGVAAFRPVELVTLRSRTIPHLRYCGCATYFDPLSADAEAMQSHVRSVGALLRDAVAFRGGFTLDGILSDQGWVATECNPRLGAALGYVNRLQPSLSMALLNHAVVAGLADVSSVALETAIVEGARRERWGGAWSVVPRPTQTEEHATYNGADVTYGPGSTGGFVNIKFDPATTPAGPPVAPRAAAALAWADEHWSLGIGPLEPADAVRSASAA
jgi:hypothetical protein